MLAHQRAFDAFDQAVGRRGDGDEPRANRAIPWWCMLFTAMVSVPAAAAATIPGRCAPREPVIAPAAGDGKMIVLDRFGMLALPRPDTESRLPPREKLRAATDCKHRLPIGDAQRVNNSSVQSRAGSVRPHQLGARLIVGGGIDIDAARRNNPSSRS